MPELSQWEDAIEAERQHKSVVKLQRQVVISSAHSVIVLGTNNNNDNLHHKKTKQQNTMTKNSIEMLPEFEFWLRKFAPDIYIFFFPHQTLCEVY